MAVHRQLKFALIGDPVEHSLSPQLHRGIYEQLHLNAGYSKVRCASEELPRLIDRFRKGEWNGLNVTLPHKQSVIPYLDDLNPRAHTIGSVNCIASVGGRLVGFNTDWFGFGMSLKVNGISVRGKPCVVLGAGGAASGIVYALLHDGASSISVANRTPAHAEHLVEKLSPVGGGGSLKAISFEELITELKHEAVIVNSTPVGMNFESCELPVPWALITSSHTLVDIIYRPVKTEFLKFGEKLGAKTMNGMDMFIYQGLASLDIWMNDRVSSAIDVSALKKNLELFG